VGPRAIMDSRDGEKKIPSLLLLETEPWSYNVYPIHYTD